jgi:hypothetical protein
MVEEMKNVEVCHEVVLTTRLIRHKIRCFCSKKIPTIQCSRNYEKTFENND